MPAGKRQQSNSMLVTLVICAIFMIIFLITTVVLYLDSGKKKTAAQDAISQLEKFASSAEQKRYPGEVGAIPSGQKSVYGALKQYYDVMSNVVLGTTVEETTAEIESQTAANQAKEIISVLAERGFFLLRHWLILIPKIPRGKTIYNSYFAYLRLVGH